MMMPSRKVSPLSTHESLSPNCTKPRTGTIRRLTPHMVAGKLTAKGIVGLSNFMTPNTNGSSTNYGIGYDGSIALGVAETNRAWTSSSKVNDHEAITFELSNSSNKDSDWPMTDATLNAWIDLAVEIATFYGFKKVAYYGDPSIYGAPDEMIITLHEWYKNKICPGPYFKRQLPALVIEINNRLNGLAPTKFVSGGSTEASSSTASNTATSNTATSTAGSEFQIKITTTALNIRKGPGSTYAVVKTLIEDMSKPNTYTIVETSGTWGRLKSGVGWISLNYTKRV